MATFNLNFSRPGGQVIASYYEFIRLGRIGYKGVQEALYAVAQYIARRLPKLGPFELIHGGDQRKGIAAVSWRIKGRKAFNLYDLADRMRTRGWLVVAYPLPKGRQDDVVMRVLVRHGFTHDMADMMLADLDRSIKQLESRPGARSLTQAEAGGFSHGGARGAEPEDQGGEESRRQAGQGQGREGQAARRSSLQRPMRPRPSSRQAVQSAASPSRPRVSRRRGRSSGDRWWCSPFRCRRPRPQAKRAKRREDRRQTGGQGKAARTTAVPDSSCSDSSCSEAGPSPRPPRRRRSAERQHRG